MGVGDTAVETERLRLRRWRADDADAFAAINAAPEVMRYIGSGATLDRAGSDELLVRLEREWEERGFGLWAVEERVAGPRPPLLGFCGLTVPMFLPEVLPAVEVGWRLALPAWGRGIATEAATAVSGSGATLHGRVNPGGGKVDVGFQFGTSTAYGSTTPSRRIGPAEMLTPFSAAITGLTMPKRSVRPPKPPGLYVMK
jgi:hypothetical protein